MRKSLAVFLALLFLAGALVFPGSAEAEGKSKKKKGDNAAVLDVLPGPDGTFGIRSLVKKFGLTYVRIVIDHQTPQDPINVLIRFELPKMKTCPSGPPPEHPSDVEATWQAAPGEDAFLPMNVWARSLSKGRQEIFLDAACSNP